MANTKISPDLPALNIAVAEAWIALSAEAIAQRNAFHIALSGGSTPKALYQLMATDHYRQQTDWTRQHIWFGDERCVPHDHADSNYRMAREAMLDSLPIPPDNIHPVPMTDADVGKNAQDYETELLACLPKTAQGIPRFDLMLQGVGDDGHTASLFPGTTILQERDKQVAAVFVEKFNAWRISVTFPVINHARHLIVLAAGAGKADIVRTLLEDKVPDALYPVQMISPEGQLTWYLDSAAARLLSPETLRN